MNLLESSHRQYRQTLILGLIYSCEELFPQEQLKIAYSISDGIYCEFENSLVSVREVNHIEEHLKTWVKSDQSLAFQLEGDSFFHCKVNEKKIKSLFPPLPRSGPIYPFRLIHYPPGFILLFSNPNQPETLSPFIPPEKLTATFRETQRWGENLHLAEVEDVNRIIQEHHSQELICLAEALHEKKVSLIADRILEQRKNVRIILISGPSSSGKTTFAQRLSTQLRVNGLRPVALSLDNYFCDREDTPKDADGHPDFEALEALDLPLLNRHLQALIQGGDIECPIYDFESGRRKPYVQKMKLSADEILVMEGIHGLNPRLLSSLDRNHLFRIYVSALFQLNIDSYNRIPTTEVRLIRRLVRDDKFRGISPENTLLQWASVRRGENTNIFPYQEEADVMFDSSLLFELNALRPYAEPLLITVPQEHPHYSTAVHLLRLLSHFNPLDISKVPFNSLLREFIGGGIYSY
ncbi:uridine kinase family protein [Desulfitobacterium metallireducens]|uniref:Uridine kinase n=1 Tax=Desulfitobacterium metallireducens DSM 15288 TaxID=871968 RepID=W0EBZ3_9FIRM|nr:nucleoside kinase [Desulfitobacterium metallireducens]AHF06699.1 uridine kinase [Desulfitobacterium metallireducens DSM 15288]